ncbi:phage protein [Niallia circulans]|uniref:hypothetical protein n=1 Tax=Niallia circulans TaxID=1397 RepID=UPI00077C4676|nr:hypothetical protein [Niallia circulans]AYV74322.1 hypothetical protein C2H98_23695 [Niallia circulans]MDR4318681.1 hypothetical protein [Niallia circulans]MED3839358.1 hypothetical protein [Niallia circulans]MED4245341.1 hypothetical protein [Niallia circulans]MED4250876.1 hypothetical protein [Niallia circulans]
MANLTELSERLFKRFKGVPNITITDATDWTEEALLEHGYKTSDNIPSEKDSLILLYAQAEGAGQIALATAHYFSYRDGEEQVDKTKISEQYRKLASDLRSQYEQKKAVTGGSNFRHLKRVDRL